MLPRTIFVQFHGKMTKVDRPSKPHYPHFVIKWKGMDWSGYRTLAECERQFAELETREGDFFSVVEQ